MDVPKRTMGQGRKLIGKLENVEILEARENKGEDGGCCCCCCDYVWRKQEGVSGLLAADPSRRDDRKQLKSKKQTKWETYNR